MKKKILVEGMNSKCIMQIEDALGEIDEVISSSIYPEEKTIIITGIKSMKNEAIIDVIDNLGYSVISIEEI